MQSVEKLIVQTIIFVVMLCLFSFLYNKWVEVSLTCPFTDKQKHVAGVVPAIEKARLYRGKGGEIMRLAVSRFIECISLYHLPLTEKIKRSLLDTLNENLRHPNSQIQVLLL